MGLFFHEQAIKKAAEEYKKYKEKTLSDVEKDYMDLISELAIKSKKN